MDTIKLMLPSEAYLDQVWTYRQECRGADIRMLSTKSTRATTNSIYKIKHILLTFLYCLVSWPTQYFNLLPTSETD